MNSKLCIQAARALEIRKSIAESIFRRKGLCPPGGRLITIPEAAIAIGTTPEKVNDIFRGRRSTSVKLKFDFGEHEVRMGRRTSFPPMISSLSVPTIGKYLRLKEMLRKGEEFEPVSNKFSRYKENMEMLRSFVLPRIIKEGGNPFLQVLPDCKKSFLLPVHELNGTIYSLPKDARLIVSCARLTCGSRRSISSEVNFLWDEVALLKNNSDLLPELGLKLWFLRDRYALGNTKAYPQASQDTIKKILASRKVEKFFSDSNPRYFNF